MQNQDRLLWQALTSEDPEQAQRAWTTFLFDLPKAQMLNDIIDREGLSHTGYRREVARRWLEYLKSIEDAIRLNWCTSGDRRLRAVS